MDAESEVQLIEAIGQALQQSGLKTKILCYDHVCVFFSPRN